MLVQSNIATFASSSVAAVTLAGVTQGRPLTVQLSYLYPGGGAGQAAPAAPTGWIQQPSPPTTIAYDASGVGTCVYKKDNSAGGSETFSVGIPGGSYGFISIAEWSGYGSYLEFGITASAGSSAINASSWDVTSASTQVANSLVLAQSDGDEGSGLADVGLAGPAGYTNFQILVNSVANEQGSHAWKEVTTEGVQTATWTKTPYNANFQGWRATIVTLHQAPAPASYRSVATSTFTASNGNATKPSGVKENDVQFALITSDNSGVTLGISGGATWTQIGSTQNITNGDNQSTALFMQVAGASEPATYGVTNSFGNYTTVTITAYLEEDTAAPVAASSVTNPNLVSVPTSPVSIAAASIDTTAARQRTLFIGTADWNSATACTFTDPAGTTRRVALTPADFGNCLVTDFVAGSAGATGTVTATSTRAGNTANSVSWQVAIKGVEGRPVANIVGSNANLASATTITVDCILTPGRKYAIGVVGEDVGGTVSIADTLSNTYTHRGSVVEATIARRHHGLTLAPTTFGATTLTVTYPATAQFRQVYVIEINGDAAFDVLGSTTDTGSNPTTAVTATNSIQPAFCVAVNMNYQATALGIGTIGGAEGTDVGLLFSASGFLEGRVISNRVTDVGSQSANFPNPAADRTTTLMWIFAENSSLLITDPPVGQTVYVGQAADFSIVATGAGTLHYQWKKSGTNVGTDSPAYNTGATTASDNGSAITCVVSDNNGSVESDPVKLGTIQRVRPSADVTDGVWTPSEGTDLYATIDEAVEDTLDYNRNINVAGGFFEVAVTSMSDPLSSTGHIIRYVISGESGGMTVSLRQGASTTIASWAHSPVPNVRTAYEQTLSSGEANSITDYTDLRLRFEATP